MANSNITNAGRLAGLDVYTGLGGGLSAPSSAVLAKVEKAMSSQKGAVAKLNQSISGDQSKLSGLGQLQSMLADFQAVARRLAGAGLLTAATSSAPDVLAVTGGGDAQAGAHSVEVKQLAQPQVLASAAQSSSSAAIGAGARTVVRIETGTAGADGFTPGKQAAKTITIDQGNNTLDGMAAALKSAGIDAAVVKSGNGYALSVKSASGADSSLRISVSGDAAVRNVLAYQPGLAASAQGMTQTAAARDAVATVDGKDVTSAANTVQTGGLTLSLKSAGKANVTVARDSTQVASNVKNLAAAYNTLQDKLDVLGKGALKSDPALAQAGRDLAGLLRNGSVSQPALAQAGLTLNGDGRLQVDDKQLNSAIAADPDAVAKLFTNGGKGLAEQFSAKVDALSGQSGAIGRETQQVNKELTALNNKKANMAQALTAQASALAKLYAAQEQSASGTSASGGGSLFDFIA